MELVTSSDPSAVDRFKAAALLLERAVLTRMVCRELIDKPEPEISRSSRADAAMNLLRAWIASRLAVLGDIKPSSGIDAMLVPEGCADLIEEIREGAKVCEDLTMLDSADTDSQWDGDMARITKSLDTYWCKHGSPAVNRAPRQPLW